LAKIAGMDKRTRREWMRDAIAQGLREHLSFADLSKRTGVHERTLRRWSARFRAEAALRSSPDREQHAFVDLVERVERSDLKAGRIEFVLPNERRIVIPGVRMVETLARALSAAIWRC
jgi:transposase-like protein